MKFEDIPPQRRRKLLNTIWSYQSKDDDQMVHCLKYKCRICADDSQQEHGVDFWDINSPVVQ